MDFALIILALLSVGVLRGLNAVAPQKKKGREPCDRDDDCAGRGLSCRGRSCQCADGWDWLGGNGFCRLSFEQCSFETPCLDPTKGRDCWRGCGPCCICADDQHSYSPKTDTCGLTVHERCYLNGVLRHDLCASGLCVGEDTNHPALAGRCSCSEALGVKKIYSPAYHCANDAFGHPCNLADEEELCRTFPSGNGLSCLEVNGSWICACPAGRTHFGGLCVVDDRSFGQECDPKGAGPTCSLDPAKTLVCDNGGSGPYNCRCQKKGLTLEDGTVVYGSMTWNNDTKQCVVRNGRKSEGGVLRHLIAILFASLYLI